MVTLGYWQQGFRQISLLLCDGVALESPGHKCLTAVRCLAILHHCE
jgi:hypothetical protein